ncbi:hypothetical protein AB0P21_18495 [Kribbella sp. NPDC056861]|uniref:hypothetical protein n=1 Tax=Kribbella sp. NPDC056861 TaxID=3154857 RepID=UPI00343F0F0B
MVVRVPRGADRRCRLKRASLPIAVTLVTLAATTGLSASVAQAATLTGRLESWSPAGWCLDSDFGGNVYIKPCQAGNLHQKWEISVVGQEDGSDIVQVKNAATDGYLTVASNAVRAQDDRKAPQTRLIAVGTGWRGARLCRPQSGSHVCVQTVQSADPGFRKVFVHEYEPSWWSMTWKRIAP